MSQSADSSSKDLKKVIKYTAKKVAKDEAKKVGLDSV
jgi:hypothetical protein